VAVGTRVAGTVLFEMGGRPALDTLERMLGGLFVLSGRTMQNIGLKCSALIMVWSLSACNSLRPFRMLE